MFIDAGDWVIQSEEKTVKKAIDILKELYE